MRCGLCGVCVPLCVVQCMLRVACWSSVIVCYVSCVVRCVLAHLCVVSCVSMCRCVLC